MLLVVSDNDKLVNLDSDLYLNLGPVIGVALSVGVSSTYYMI